MWPLSFLPFRFVCADSSLNRYDQGVEYCFRAKCIQHLNWQNQSTVNEQLCPNKSENGQKLEIQEVWLMLHTWAKALCTCYKQRHQFKNAKNFLNWPQKQESSGCWHSVNSWYWLIVHRNQLIAGESCITMNLRVIPFSARGSAAVAPLAM